MTKPSVIIPDSWAALNVQLLSPTVTEPYCEQMLQQELNGQRRLQFVMRIHSRLNKLRAHRERAELKQQCGA